MPGADDLFDPCLFLASRASGFVTGHTLLVDGGTMSVAVHGQEPPSEAA